MTHRVLTAGIVVSALFMAAAAGLAQTAGVALGTCASAAAGACQGFSVAVFVDDVRVSGDTVSLRVGPDHLRLSAWSAETFGPLGNVVFEFGGELRSGPVARARLAARGVIASVAARAAILAAGADEERFDPLAVAQDGRPLVGGPTLGLELGGTFRLDRQIVLDVAPALYLAPAGLSIDGLATLRLVRALGPNELQAHLQASVLPSREGHAALGGSLVLPRGRAPDWEFTVWAGFGPTGPLPGASISLAEDLDGGFRVRADAAYQPYRRDARPLRGTLGVTAQLGAPTLELQVSGGALHPREPDALAARLSLTWRLGEGFR